ncbi:MAG: 50S ribosomal protein L13 [Acidobacteria bacterium]|nr:50S ribosomal protein L13 [Acidobacteriota bacterium]
MKTYVPRKKDIHHNWFVVDAEGMVLGRLATQVAHILAGKHKASYVPFLDCGDSVIVINAAKVEMTGRKLEQKVYRHHTGYLGHLKEVKAKRLLAQRPERIIEHAVRGMLPKNKMGRQMIKKLRVYAGPNHNHQAQRPVELKF